MKYSSAGVQGSRYSDENADKLCADWFDDGDALADVFFMVRIWHQSPGSTLFASIALNYPS